MKHEQDTRFNRRNLFKVAGLMTTDLIGISAVAKGVRDLHNGKTKKGSIELTAGTVAIVGSEYQAKREKLLRNTTIKGIPIGRVPWIILRNIDNETRKGIHTRIDEKIKNVFDINQQDEDNSNKKKEE